MAKKKDITGDLSTEEKIKEAARQVFTKKGYAATRTRDIAEEAGINLALLNYYFRSKEKLFEIVIMEKMQLLLGKIGPVLTDEKTTIEEKVEDISEHYISTLIANPDIPLFVLGEIRNNPEKFANLIMTKTKIVNSAFFKQLAARRPDIDPLHFIFNMLGLIIFPFIGKPLIQLITGIPSERAVVLMNERKKLIKTWFQAMLDAK
ncbi:TetR/AcrR family transcriptional regulator [Parapedobacter koreensis]|uniref:Transcriptional regulator, TetR family n=1 Tax=Parapedobacter koreensis TaxID=332977 RepID=A0A1H7U2E6_9SPHI|nr:TetR/AcrR family transcriptional regulator [Parapedobacter koreensis]SEL91123.1 transcriptional regulator, TetR family [Parapedobacter koreensis]